MAAPVGNQNARKAKDWENALRRVLAQYATADGVVKQGEALAKIAEQCVVQAISGDKDARAEIANRLDGKVPQPVGGTDELPPIRNVTRIELVDLDGSGPSQTTP